jgi:hypothetical protein
MSKAGKAFQSYAGGFVMAAWFVLFPLGWALQLIAVLLLAAARGVEAASLEIGNVIENGRPLAEQCWHTRKEQEEETTATASESSE